MVNVADMSVAHACATFYNSPEDKSSHSRLSGCHEYNDIWERSCTVIEYMSELSMGRQSL